jgi:hypothetical protein
MKEVYWYLGWFSCPITYFGMDPNIYTMGLVHNELTVDDLFCSGN